MLRQRSLNDWLARWVEAQQTFEASVTACFSARHDMHLTLDQVVEGVISSRPLAASSKAAEDLISRSQDRDSSGQNLLISRCREIMAAHARRKQEGDSASAQGSVTSSQNRADRLPQQAMARQPPAALLSVTPKSSLPSFQPALSVTPTTSLQAPVAKPPDRAQVPTVEETGPP